MNTSGRTASTSIAEPLPPIQRTIHVICNSAGEFLCELVGGNTVWSKDHAQAYRAGLWWLSYSEARNRLRQFQLLRNRDDDCGIATITLESRPSDPLNWELVFTSYDIAI